MKFKNYKVLRVVSWGKGRFPRPTKGVLGARLEWLLHQLFLELEEKSGRINSMVTEIELGEFV
jgi:hypothetical protein